AEGAVAAAEREAPAAPAVADVGRGLGEGDQGGLRHGAGDGHIGRIADVLLGEDGQVVEVQLRIAARAARHPRRQVLAALADAHAKAAAWAVERGGGAGAAAALAFVQRGELAVVREAADRAEDAAALVAQQGEGAAGLEAEAGIQGLIARTPTCARAALAR